MTVKTNEEKIKTASLDEIEAMKKRGELYHDPNAPEGEGLGDEFWDDAKIVNPMEKK